MYPTIHDYTPNYLHTLPAKDQTTYIQAFPDLFDHYFTFWSFDHISYSFNKAHVEDGRKVAWEGLNQAVNTLNNHGYDLTGIRVVLFVGNGTANGHAYIRDGKAYVWIPVEDYPDVFTSRIFIVHEFFHAFHYLVNREFWFEDHMAFKDLLRQLVIEGIATSGSLSLLELSEEDALWGNYLNQDEKSQWIQDCRNQFGELSRYILDLLQKGRDDMDLIYPFEPDNIYRFRGGYYAGLQLVNQVMEKENLSIDDLMKKGYEDWKGIVKSVFG